MDFKPARNAFAAADAGRLCNELRVLIPNDPELGRLGEFVHFALSGGPRPNGVSASTAFFLDNIAHVTRPSAKRGRQGRRFLSCDFDFIADLGGATRWSLAHALNRLALDRIEPTQRSAVIGTMRNDGIYITEWVAHYLALGFDHLFIYTNDNTDGSDELLSLLAQHGIITLIENEISGAVPPEAKAFGHALNVLSELRDYEWALFVDSDEFFVPAQAYDNSVRNLLASITRTSPDNRVAGVCYDWLWFISDMIFGREPGLLCERFQHARPHWLSKCLVRVRDVLSMRHQHHPELVSGYEVVDSAFQPLDLARIWERRQPQYSGGRINHYWPRSFEEFAIKKARGAALGIDNNLYDRPYEKFFAWNGYASPGNRYATDPRLLRSVKERIDMLRTLEGIAACADRIDREFPMLLGQVGSTQRLQQEYDRSRSEPGDL
jgi:hypothetical protein